MAGLNLLSTEALKAQVRDAHRPALHEATPVTRGVRYAFLPFLYDEETAPIRARYLDAQATESATSADESADIETPG